MMDAGGGIGYRGQGQLGGLVYCCAANKHKLDQNEAHNRVESQSSPVGVLLHGMC